MSFFVRSLLAVTLAAVASLPARAAVPENGVLVFDIERDGSIIGTHRFDFDRDGERIDVAIDIDIKVKMLLVTVFAYEHRNRETWQDGRLVRLETQTDDDGTMHLVRGEETPKGFHVLADDRQLTIPDPVTPTSYWAGARLGPQTLLNTQTGELMDVTIRAGDETRIVARGEQIDARHYIIEGDLRLELWYDADDILVGLRFKAQDGSVISYSLRPPSRTTARDG